MLTQSKYQLIVTALWGILLILKAYIAIPIEDTIFYSVAGGVWSLLVVIGVGVTESKVKKMKRGVEIPY